MTLKTKNIKNAQLVEVTDWKATGISIDYNEMKAQSIMSGYVSKEAMDNNAEPLEMTATTSMTNFDILKRLNRLEKEVFGKQILDNSDL